MKTTEQLLNDIKEAGVITEKEMLLIKGRSNKVNKDLWNYELEDIKVTQSQTVKGLDWLKDQYQTPKGIERKNNPFGYREIEVLEDPEAHCYFRGFYSPSRYNNYFIPVYLLCGAGTSFEYYVNGGKIEIIG